MNYTLPFSALVPDNQRHGVVVIGGKPRILLTSKYRKAKEQVVLLLWAQQGKEPMLRGELGMLARMYVPDKRRRDVLNYSKLVNDSLAHVAYEDDSQLRDVRWVHGGIDREDPRLEIELWEVG